MKKNTIFLYVLVAGVLTLAGCEKFLNEKPEKNLKLPSEMMDFLAILNNTGAMNNVAVGLGEVSSDNVMFAENTINTYSEFDRNIYTWQAPIMPEEASSSEPWMRPYTVIYNSNIIIEGMSDVNVSDSERGLYNDVLGRAYFFRAYNHLVLISTWKGPYTDERKDLLGVPVRTFSDINRPNPRSTIQEVYDQIEDDILKSISLLPVNSTVMTMPNKISAYALATRFYLLRGDYDQVDQYADSVLNHNSYLIDYQNINTTVNFPFTMFNDEVLFHVFGSFNLANRAGNLGVSRELYEMYHDEDIRKKAFFTVNANGTIRFKGSYNGNGFMFTGLTTAEVILNKSESNVRLGNFNVAKNTLRTLLTKRYSAEFDVDDYLEQGNLLQLVLNERRCELAFRDMRWSDLQRYYYIDGNFKPMTRRMGGENYVFTDQNLNLPYPDNFLVFNDY